MDVSEGTTSFEKRVVDADDDVFDDGGQTLKGQPDLLFMPWEV